jgi:hypothetical protein
LDVQVNDNFEAPAQAGLQLSARPFANFAPLRLCEELANATSRSRKGAKAQSSQRFFSGQRSYDFDQYSPAFY